MDDLEEEILLAVQVALTLAIVLKIKKIIEKRRDMRRKHPLGKNI